MRVSCQHRREGCRNSRAHHSAATILQARERSYVMTFRTLAVRTFRTRDETEGTGDPGSRASPMKERLKTNLPAPCDGKPPPASPDDFVRVWRQCYGYHMK